MPEKAPDPIAMRADERRSVGIIALVAMIRMFGLFALLPVLSLYADGLGHSTPLLVGLAVGGYGLTQAALQVPLGALSDRVGRMPVIVGGLAVFAAGSILAGTSDSIYGVVAGRLLQGAGAISATLTALVTDATRESVRTRSMAFVGIGIGSSFLIAMVTGPLLAAKFGVPALFWIAAVLALVAALLLQLLPDIPRPQARASWNIMPAFRADLLRVDLYVFLLHAIMTATFVALPFLLRDRLGIDMIGQGKLYFGALVMSLVISVPMIMADHHQGQTRLASLAVMLIIAAQLGMAFFSLATLPVFLSLVLYFAGFNFLEASLPARLSVLADQAVRGASLGVFSSAQFLGAFAGGLLGGRFHGPGRQTDVFFICVLLGAIWLALQGFGRLRTEKPAGN